MQSRELLPECLGEGVEQCLVTDQQPLQPAEHSGFQVGHSDAVAGVAGALFPPRGAVVAIPARDGHAAATAGADREARQQALLGLAHVADPAGVAALQLLNAGPGFVIDDPELRDLGGDPLRFRVGARDSLAGLGILHEMLPVPDQPAEIELVVEDTISALAAAELPQLSAPS